MIHNAFRKAKFVANATPYDIDGVPRVKFSGGLTYQYAGREESAWIGGYFGEDRAGDPPAPWPKRWQAWDPDRLNRFADSVVEPILGLNIEHYGDAGIGRIVDIIEAIRDRRPDLAIGLWSIVPKSQFWVLQDYAQFIDWKAGRPHFKQLDSWWNHPAVGPARVRAFEDWQAGNDRAARRLVPHIDFVCPSVYPVKDRGLEPIWTLAREPELMIAECRRVAPGLPVLATYYPFLSTTKLPASPALTEAILNACRKADATIIFGDVNTKEPVVRGAFEIALPATAQAKDKVADYVELDQPAPEAIPEVATNETPSESSSC